MVSAKILINDSRYYSINAEIHGMRRGLIILFFVSIICVPARLAAQGGVHVMKARVINGDTILVSDLPEVSIYPSYKYRNRWDYWRYQRLVKNVKTVYPYAKLAAQKLQEIDRTLATIKGEKKRKQYIKLSEKQMMDDFEGDIKNLTITQGRILLKLIDRETGNTTYYILQDLKGNFSAVFWQTIARVFGSNLKSEYDPLGEDRLIEQIVLMIDAGQL